MGMGFRDTISGVTCMDIMHISGAISGASSGINFRDMIGVDINGALTGVTGNLMDIMRMDMTGAKR